MVKNTCENLQNALDKGQNDIEDLYLNVLESFGHFINQFNELTKNLSKLPLFNIKIN